MVTYLFEDEFAGPAGSPPDSSKWTYDHGPWSANAELETYARSTKNVFLDGNGHLVIRAHKTATGYTSGRVKTQGLFEHTYGCYEARINLTPTQGFWPAWWMIGANYPDVGWPHCGEVDIVEQYATLDYAETTVQTPDAAGEFGPATAANFADAPGVANGWHTYRMWWTPTEYVFHKDGTEYLTVDYSYSHPFFMILNLAVGGLGGGPVPDDTKFPVDMLVDYVRVW